MDTPRPGDKGWLIDQIEQAHSDALLDEAEYLWGVSSPVLVEENHEAA